MAAVSSGEECGYDDAGAAGPISVYTEFIKGASYEHGDPGADLEGIENGNPTRIYTEQLGGVEAGLVPKGVYYVTAELLGTPDGVAASIQEVYLLDNDSPKFANMGPCHDKEDGAGTECKMIRCQPWERKTLQMDSNGQFVAKVVYQTKAATFTTKCECDQSTRPWYDCSLEQDTERWFGLRVTLLKSDEKCWTAQQAWHNDKGIGCSDLKPSWCSEENCNTLHKQFWDDNTNPSSWLELSADVAGCPCCKTPTPTAGPTPRPTMEPTKGPTKGPSNLPSAGPTVAPSASPTLGPTKVPTVAPSALLPQPAQLYFGMSAETEDEVVSTESSVQEFNDAVLLALTRAGVPAAKIVSVTSSRASHEQPPLSRRTRRDAQQRGINTDVQAKDDESRALIVRLRDGGKVQAMFRGKSYTASDPGKRIGPDSRNDGGSGLGATVIAVSIVIAIVVIATSMAVGAAFRKRKRDATEDGVTFPEFEDEIMRSAPNRRIARGSGGDGIIPSDSVMWRELGLHPIHCAVITGNEDEICKMILGDAARARSPSLPSIGLQRSSVASGGPVFPARQSQTLSELSLPRFSEPDIAGIGGGLYAQLEEETGSFPRLPDTAGDDPQLSLPEGALPKTQVERHIFANPTYGTSVDGRGNSSNVHYVASGPLYGHVYDGLAPSQTVGEADYATVDSTYTNGAVRKDIDWGHQDSASSKSSSAPSPLTLSKPSIVDTIGQAGPLGASSSLRSMSVATSDSISPDQPDTRGNTPLHWAATSGQPRMIRCLTRLGADTDALNLNGSRPLHVAAALLDDSAVVRELLAAGASVDAVDHDGNTALMLAAGRGSLAVVEALLSSGAEVAPQSKIGLTALASAVIGSHEAVVKRLLVVPLAGVGAGDLAGRTPLHWATALNLSNISSQLVQAPGGVAAVFVDNENGDNCVHVAAKMGSAQALSAIWLGLTDSRQRRRLVTTPNAENYAPAALAEISIARTASEVRALLEHYSSTLGLPTQPVVGSDGSDRDKSEVDSPSRESAATSGGATSGSDYAMSPMCETPESAGANGALQPPANGSASSPSQSPAPSAPALASHMPPLKKKKKKAKQTPDEAKARRRRCMAELRVRRAAEQQEAVAEIEMLERVNEKLVRTLEQMQMEAIRLRAELGVDSRSYQPRRPSQNSTV